MSLSSATYDLAEQEILLSPSGLEEKRAALDVVKALKAEHLATVKRLQEQHCATARLTAWAKGLRGDGVAKADGFTETHTGVLRRFAALGEVNRIDYPDEELSRHVCEIRRRLRQRNSGIKIDTLVGVGYQLVAGWEELIAMLQGRASRAARIPGYTPKETDTLYGFYEHGSQHVDQTKTLQRYISRLRAKLPAHIVIITEGEGLYSVSRETQAEIGRLLAGEIEAAPCVRQKPKPKALPAPKPKRTRKLEEGAALAA